MMFYDEKKDGEYTSRFLTAAKKFVHPIIIISDPSYNTSYGLQVAMDKIFSTIRDNPKSYYIYGIVERLNWHVESFAREYRVPREKLLKVHFKKDVDPVFISRVLGSLIHTLPSKLIVFRDNNTSDIAGELIDRFIATNKVAEDIDSYGNTKMLSRLSSQDVRPNYYYKENPYDEHWVEEGVYRR